MDEGTFGEGNASARRAVLALGYLGVDAPLAEIVSPQMSFPNGCHVCEVEIDPETGLLEVVRYSAVG